RVAWWRRVRSPPLREWRAPHLLIPLMLVLALPVAGLWARGVMATTALVLTLQVGFVLIDIFMEEVTYRGVVLQALSRFSPVLRVVLAAILFGFSHLDNLFLPGADELGVAYQIFEAALSGILFGAVRLRMNTIWPVMAVKTPYDLMRLPAFGPACPVAPTVPGVVVDTVVTRGLAVVGFSLLSALPALTVDRREAA